MAEGEPQELKEYEYRVGHLPVTAMLTEKMAKRLDAKPVGESENPEVGKVVNNEASRQATAGREADESGVTNKANEAAAEKARTARNKRAQ